MILHSTTNNLPVIDRKNQVHKKQTISILIQISMLAHVDMDKHPQSA